MEVAHINIGDVVFIEDEEVLVLNKPIIDEERFRYYISYINSDGNVACCSYHFYKDTVRIETFPRQNITPKLLSDNIRKKGEEYLQWLRKDT